MAFTTCRSIKSDSNPSYLKEQVVPLAGPDGVIAKYVETLDGDAGRCEWNLNSDELLEFMGVATDRIIIFGSENQVSETSGLMQLVSLCGGSHEDRTDLIAQFQLLKVVGTFLDDEGKPGFRLDPEVSGKSVSEALSLTGGTASRAQSWKWTRPHMDIGSAIVG